MLLLFRSDGSIGKPDLHLGNAPNSNINLVRRYRESSFPTLFPPPVHPISIASAPGSPSTSLRVKRSTSPDMHLRKHLIQRWIGDDASTKQKVPSHVAIATADDPDEAEARQTHDHYAALDWEREEFEREMALRFVMDDLSLGLDEGATTPSVTISPQASPRPSNLRISKRPRTPWPRSPSPVPTLTPNSATSTLPPLSLSPSSPGPPPSPPLARPTSLLTSMLNLPHRCSPSVLSLPATHFSCTSSSSDAQSISARSLVSHVGRRFAPKLNGAVEISPGSHLRPRRHVSVPTPLTPKKRRLVVRGISMDDDRAVEGIKRWANGLGVVSRVVRTSDGALWIEFQDKRVAENVCCLQAQVLIPDVGRVVLDWAEGRHPG